MYYKILTVFIGILMLNSVIGNAEEKSRYDRNAVPIIVEGGGSGTFDIGNERDVNFIGRISFTPYTLPNNGIVNLIICEDWKGRKNVFYHPDNFCGAQISNNSRDYMVYANPIIVQVPVDKINGNVSTYSLAEIKGSVVRGFYVINFIWGTLTDPIVYADEINIISENDIENNMNINRENYEIRNDRIRI